MTNNITDLRAVLFDTLQKIKDGTIDTDRAKSINDIAQTIVNSAKVEVDHMKVAGGAGSGFLSHENGQRPLAVGEHTTEKTANGTETVTALPGGATITRHRMG